MSLLQQAREDYQRYIESSNGFGTDVVLTPPTGDAVNVRALCSSISIQVDPETGQIMNVKNVHFTISEATLVAASYSVRVDNEVDLKGHKITFSDSAGIERTYRCSEWWPSETLGVIVVQVGKYNG